MTPEAFKKTHGLSDREMEYYQSIDADTRFINAMHNERDRAYEELEMLLECIIAYGIPITEILIVHPYIEWANTNEDLQFIFEIGLKS